MKKYIFVLFVTFGIIQKAQADSLEDSFNRIQIITSVPNYEMAGLKANLKSILESYDFNVSDVIHTAEKIAKSGVPFKNINIIEKNAADLATATGSSLQTAADIIVMTSRIWSAVQYETISNWLANTVNKSGLSLDELKIILSTNGTNIGEKYIELDQCLAFFTALSNEGINSLTIANGIHPLLQEIFSPNEKFTDFLTKQYETIDEKVTNTEAFKKFSNFKYNGDPLVSVVTELRRIDVMSPRYIKEFERVTSVTTLKLLKPLLTGHIDLQSIEVKIKTGKTAYEVAYYMNLKRMKN